MNNPRNRAAATPAGGASDSEELKHNLAIVSARPGQLADSDLRASLQNYRYRHWVLGALGVQCALDALDSCNDSRGLLRRSSGVQGKCCCSSTIVLCFTWLTPSLC